MPERILSKIESEKNQTPRSRDLRFSIRSQIALAASLIGFAFFSYVVVRTLVPQQTEENGYFDIAILDEMNAIPDDAYIMDLLPAGEEGLSETDIWINAAVEYLANSDVEIDLLLEQY
ncbi:MAG: hypothetical protein JXR52_05035 [Bacteroidales bacterium]|nr:hypothetical protein [Bacteroidales bacterium]